MKRYARGKMFQRAEKETKDGIRLPAAYRGYLLSRSPFRSDITISKGGSFVSWAKDVQDAQRQVDLIAD